MLTILTLTVLTLVLAGCGAVWYWIKRAPAGYEDDTGFHFCGQAATLSTGILTSVMQSAHSRGHGADALAVEVEERRFWTTSPGC